MRTMPGLSFIRQTLSLDYERANAVQVMLLKWWEQTPPVVCIDIDDLRNLVLEWRKAAVSNYSLGHNVPATYINMCANELSALLPVLPEKS